MLKLSNYEIFDKIYISSNTVIYKGYFIQNKKPVIIKTYKNQQPSLEEINLLKHEYHIAKDLNIEGIIKPYNLESYNNELALVLEYFEGRSLDRLIECQKFELKDFLKIAIQLAHTLSELHKNQIIHKDIKSSNILLNIDTKQAKIIDFAIATRWSPENPNTSNTNTLEGTLAYMSPEQTGRMNRYIDYRSDYYSLGVTFYEMLTGQLPFVATDPMELIHCHIAKKPVPPHELNSEIPEMVSEIIMKLLAKNPEDRYQSALGLKYDLEFCLTQLTNIGAISDFIIGKKDLFNGAYIPQKVYNEELAPTCNLLPVTKTTKLTAKEVDALDLSTVLKVSCAISEEICLHKLLDKLMQILIENTGAQRGLLVLQKSGELVLAAEGSLEFEKSVLIPFVPIQENLDLPISIIKYVANNKETLVLNNAIQETLCNNDTYILKHQPQSVLCLPIIYQNNLTGLLYLENSITQGVFTRDRLKVLSLLCTQISISIENANLYSDLQSHSQELEEKNQALQESEAREREKARQLEATLQQLQNTQLQLIQNEKLCSLGQMVAGIAHEINNPVTFITANLSHTSNYTEDLLHLINLYQFYYPNPVDEIKDEIEAMDLEFLQEDLPKMLKSLKVGADRIKEIIRNLRNFSRQDSSELTLQDIHEGIDTNLMILQHRLKAQPHRPAIEVIRDYSDLPMVQCYAGLLNQVFMNLLANAIDAVEESFVKSQESFVQDKGLLTHNQGLIQIRTEISDSDRVTIRIADNGSGMPDEVRCKLFSPFFTTKPIGKGTGIGLSISRQIIEEKHKGQLSCVSSPGQGAEFIIEIPLRQQCEEKQVDEMVV
ncbi:protein kinase [Scytonema sp. UIC 10036]|uniref:protein kinase domain-containing protein n=1 Tax=Scytonema sp. UIC 10036 TaxID=2304196 RepID=UPI0012DA3CF9|nr:protein kinase [Scytonema sp. UIC 10036]MUG92076.1 protein kinase [Scytonema sp. UIC 10036]